MDKVDARNLDFLLLNGQYFASQQTGRSVLSSYTNRLRRFIS